ncbi:leukocyte cell-derived chemotaxin-2-like isoform X1 [Xyrauchen texanus]|uniref:leukocyte cell-derived chemotaxin-2-like isoform X1 n=2 Tax=Xyrauchen texanus TaxID=154827 RepID=UPI0022424CB2|nr:leukocyte cell-derived chemotaxin-2-like isoform X1 [Xyrauchen texanus]
MKFLLIYTVLLCLFLMSLSLENVKKRNEKERMRKFQKGERMKIVQSAKKLTAIIRASKMLNRTRGTGPRDDMGCTSIGGICQWNTFICQGRYLKDKCREGKSHQCCTSAAAWSTFCAGSHHNRVRACDNYGCGGFNSKRMGLNIKAVDIVCDDYGIINAPFSGSLSGPVGRTVGDSIQYDGVKLYNTVHCVKIFSIRPYSYSESVVQGEAMGYLLPLQERFSGITSHLQLQMCDGSDPAPFI